MNLEYSIHGVLSFLFGCLTLECVLNSHVYIFWDSHLIGETLYLFCHISDLTTPLYLMP